MLECLYKNMLLDIIFCSLFFCVVKLCVAVRQGIGHYKNIPQYTHYNSKCVPIIMWFSGGFIVTAYV